PATQVTVFALSFAPAPAAGGASSFIDDVARRGRQALDSVSSCFDDIMRWAGGARNGTNLTQITQLSDDIARSVRVYRVEGVTNQRIAILENRLVEISGDGMLFLNFGDKRRSLEFFDRRVMQAMEGVSIKSFEVPESFLNYLREIAVPEELAREFPQAPLIVDITKAADQFGLRREQIDQLIEVIIQGTGIIQP